MALIEEFEKSGNWLFTWRSYLPLLVMALYVLGMWQEGYAPLKEPFDDVWGLVCLGVGLIGLGIRAVTIGRTPRGTSGRNTDGQIAESLNTTGIYSVVRHPLYLGNFIMGLGLSLYARVWWLTLIYMLVFWLYYERIMFAEEAFLRRKFGDAYLTWAETTPAFIPSPRRWTRSDLPFSMRNVLKREYNGLFALVLTLVILHVIGRLIAGHAFWIDRMWQIILAASFLIWITLRTLKKKSSLLQVEGR